MAILDIERLNRMPFAVKAGYSWTTARDGEAVVVMETTAEHGNGFGHVHGGMLSVLADSVGTTAIGSVGGMRAITVDLRVNYLRGAEVGTTITARAKATHIAGNTGFATIEITDAGGQVLCLAQLTGILRPRTD